MTEAISSTSSFDQLNRKTAHVAFLSAKTVSSSFTRHCILTTISKNRNILFCHNNYYCFRQHFRTILHWHWHAFSWPLAPASKDGKIITFLPSMCEWSRYRSLHVVSRLLVVITSFCPSCEAALIRTAYIHRLTFLALNRPRQALFMTAPGWMPACTITVTIKTRTSDRDSLCWNSLIFWHWFFSREFFYSHFILFVGLEFVPVFFF